MIGWLAGLIPVALLAAATYAAGFNAGRRHAQREAEKTIAAEAEAWLEARNAGDGASR